MGGWGVSPTGKPFRVVPCVRACVRAVWMPSENPAQTCDPYFPFSLWPHQAFPCPFGRAIPFSL